MVPLLESVRELKLLGIDVFFEEQNIHTMSSDGELMLTILASYAQEESRSVSENMKWRIKKNFEEGLPWNGTLLGYRLKNGKYEIVPEEAEIVKSIFADYLSGLGLEAIMKRLKSKEVKTRKDNNWHISCVRRILCNYTYTGNLLLQKYYSENHLTKKKMVNEGQLPQYHATDTHEAIISLEDFNRVQEEMERRRTKFNPPKKRPQAYTFSGLIECEKCGKNYRRKTTVTGVVWICQTFNSEGKSVCASKQIPEDELQRVTADINLASVEKIIAKENNTLTIHFKDGRSEKRIWNSRSRAESWTPEMKEAARQKTLERSKKKCQMSK